MSNPDAVALDTRDVEVLRVVGATRGPATVPSEVAEALDVTPDTARRRLDEHVEAGLLERKKHGGRLTYWAARDAPVEAVRVETDGGDRKTCPFCETWRGHPSQWPDHLARCPATPGRRGVADTTDRPDDARAEVAGVGGGPRV